MKCYPSRWLKTSSTAFKTLRFESDNPLSTCFNASIVPMQDIASMAASLTLRAI